VASTPLFPRQRGTNTVGKLLKLWLLISKENKSSWFIPGDSTGFPASVISPILPTEWCRRDCFPLPPFWKKKDTTFFVYDCLGPSVPLDLQKQVQAILAYQPQIVGFSATTSSFPDAADLAQTIKNHFSNITTVCGGVHVSALEGKLLKDYPRLIFLLPEKVKKRYLNWLPDLIPLKSKA